MNRLNRIVIFLMAIFLSACSIAPKIDSLVVKNSDMHKLDSSEIRVVYEQIAGTFPLQSKPIDESGVTLLFGREAIEILSVPALTTLKERADYCGVRSVSGSEVTGLLHANPMAIAPKVLALGCTAFTKPNLPVKAPEKSEINNTNGGIAFRGDQ